MKLPHDLLPAPEPRYAHYHPDYFYQNVVKPLVVDVVRIMDNGLNIDLHKVANLEEVLETQLGEVTTSLYNNKLVDKYLSELHETLKEKARKASKGKLKPIDVFLKEFNPKDPVHRSYFMYIYSTKHGMSQPTELLPTGIPKWSAKLVKKLSNTNPFLHKLVDKTISPTNSTAQEAMQLLAKHKQSLYNEKYLTQISNPVVPFPEFNPGSSKQKRELFSLLGITADKVSKKTGEYSFDRDEIERINREYSDPDIVSLTNALLEHSSAAIVRNNFIEAFYTFTVNNRLYGSLKVFGAKSFRLTSNKPNMLNMPSTKSVFSKPIKECFTAPTGFLVATIDYSALEDRVIASLSKDTNKCSIFLEGLDGHSLAATYYYRQRVIDVIGEFSSNREAAKLLKAIVDDETDPNHKIAKEIRQNAKPISFGLAYGAFPKKVAQSVKIPLADAEVIFNAYHNEMFPGISQYREEYVLPTAEQQGYIHLGLGCIINTDDPERDIRTLNNATAQFWSILTLLTINKLHYLIDKAGYQNDIFVTATIYDSIYMEVRADPVVIQWLNNTIVPIMETDFMVNQIIKNEASLEIGPSWADLHNLPHEASLETIKKVISIC